MSTLSNLVAPCPDLIRTSNAAYAGCTREIPELRSRDGVQMGTGTPQPCWIATLLNELTRQFHQVKLMSRSSLVSAYGKKFRAAGRDHPKLAFLSDVTDDEVRRHYEEDHDQCAHQFRDPMKDVERTLQGVMRQAPLTLCVELKRGRNKGMRVPHPGRVRSYIETAKAYDALFPRTNKK